MYKYAATDSIFDGVSNMYLISIATAFLAVILAFYSSNFLKNESESQLKEVLNDLADDHEEGEENYPSDTEMENYDLQQGHLEENTSLSTGDCYDNNTNKSFSISEISDTDYDSDEMQVDGLIRRLKCNRVKDLENQLTKEQLQEEKRIEREQLAAIFELLKKQEAELNMKEIDELELSAQLALYR